MAGRIEGGKQVSARACNGFPVRECPEESDGGASILREDNEAWPNTSAPAAEHVLVPGLLARLEQAREFLHWGWCAGQVEGHSIASTSAMAAIQIADLELQTMERMIIGRSTLTSLVERG